MVKICRSSSALSSVWVNSNEKMSDFYASSWQTGDGSVPMLIVRLCCLTFALAILTWSIHTGSNLYWLLFLTNWGMTLVAAMCLAGVIVSISAVKGDLTDTEKVPPWYVATYWVLYNISIGMALVISLLYWTLLYGPELKEDKKLFYLEVLNHAGNSLIVIVEVLASRTPVRAAHVYQPLLVGIWYSAFTAIYYLAGGTDGNEYPVLDLYENDIKHDLFTKLMEILRNGLHYIYNLLDWQHTKRTLLIVFLAIVALILLYFIVYGIACARDKISESLRT